MTVDILPQRVFSLVHPFVLQLSCPGLVLTRHLGHALGHSDEPARPSGAHGLAEEMGAPRSSLVHYMCRDRPSVCCGTEAWGLWAGDRGDLGSAGVQRSEG